MLPSNKVYIGNCFEVMRAMDNKSVDMIVTKLPLGVDLEKLWNEYNRIAKPNTPIVLMANNPFAAKVIASNLKMYRHDVIWYWHGTDIHEMVLVFSKKKPTYNRGSLPEPLIFVESYEYGVYPSQHPVLLFEYLIKTYSNEGNLILDSFADCGSVGIAAQNTKRNYILIEKNPSLRKVINRRINL